MTQATYERWKAEHCFGVEAVATFVGPTLDPHQCLTGEQLRAIAARSSIPYWTDDKRLWTIEGQAGAAPGTRLVTPLEALRAFGLDQLVDAREFGSTAR